MHAALTVLLIIASIAGAAVIVGCIGVLIALHKTRKELNSPENEQ